MILVLCCFAEWGPDGCHSDHNKTKFEFYIFFFDTI